MLINTTRFGNVEVKEGDVIHFLEGLLGFNDLRNFVLLDDPDDDIFAWLQSCEVGNVAFPILEPEIFSDTYKVKLGKRDFEALNLTDLQSNARVYTIITIPDDPKMMTANLKAPVIINVSERKARQCVLQDNDMPIRHQMFTELQKRVVLVPDKSIKEQTMDEDLAVRILPNTERLIES